MLNLVTFFKIQWIFLWI